MFFKVEFYFYNSLLIHLLFTISFSFFCCTRLRVDEHIICKVSVLNCGKKQKFGV